MKKYRKLAAVLAIMVALLLSGCGKKEFGFESGGSRSQSTQSIRKEKLELSGGQISLQEKETLLVYDIYEDEMLCGIITPIEEHAMHSGIVSYTRIIFVWNRKERQINLSLNLKPEEYLIASAVLEEEGACFSAMPVKSDFEKDSGQLWDILTTDFSQVVLIDSGKAPFYANAGTPTIVRQDDGIKYMYYDLSSPNGKWGIKRIEGISSSDMGVDFEEIQPENIILAGQNRQPAFLAVRNGVEGIAVWEDGKFLFVENSDGTIYALTTQAGKVIYSCGEKNNSQLYYLTVYDIATGKKQQIQTSTPLTKLAATETFLLAAGSDWNTYQIVIREKEIEVCEYEIYPEKDAFMFIPSDDEVLVNNLMDYRQMCFITKE